MCSSVLTLLKGFGQSLHLRPDDEGVSTSAGFDPSSCSTSIASCGSTCRLTPNAACASTYGAALSHDIYFPLNLTTSLSFFMMDAAESLKSSSETKCVLKASAAALKPMPLTSSLPQREISSSKHGKSEYL